MRTKTRPSRKYRPRRARSGAPPPLQITPRDVEIIRHVARYRFLNSDHIRRLVPGSAKNIGNRLKALFEHGYLDRPDCQYDTYRPGGGASPIVYALADRGAHLLASTATDAGSARGSWTQKNKSVGRPFLEHTLAIADFSVAMRAAIDARAAVDLIEGEELIAGFPNETRAQAKPYRVSVPVFHQSTRMDIGLEPDYAFSLYLPKAKRRAFFLVEIDRGTMPVERERLHQSSILRKLLAYQAFWQSKRQQQHFGWRNFRVLFVTTSTERVKHMLAAVDTHTAIKGSPLFWFADKQTLYASPDILAQDWRDCSGSNQSLLP